MHFLKHIQKILFLFLLLFISVSGVYLTFYASGPLGTSINDNEMEIYIPKGTGSLEIAQKLVDLGVLHHVYGFILRAKIMEKLHKLQAGEYLIKHQMNMEELILKIASGDVIHRSFPVVEGTTVAEVVKKLNDNALLSGDIQNAPPEGSLMPATYPYHRGEDRKDLLTRMQKSMDVTLAELWEKKSEDCPLKSPQEVLILASIIEKETSRKREEQPLIAGVFFNRLKDSMRLQSDPTVIYALTLGKNFLGRNLSLSDLKYNSPFNTYTHHGLPPTPIACPSKHAIEAALHPTKTEALFFVADGTGGHSFSKTLAGHNSNVAKWRAFCAQKTSTCGE